VFEDINFHIALLEQVLNNLPEVLSDSFTEILLINKQQWLEHFKAYKETGDEITFNSLIQEEIEPFLFQVAETSDTVREIIQPYFNSVSETQGSFHKNRREMERSMQIINENINLYLTNHLKELQKIFPRYFEKFRTDGVEYDIYLGQSIAPYKTFTLEHVKHMRLWQLKSMAEIGKITRDLKSQLSKPLQTTQLIFIHSSPISISFRNDEKRFDVEGAYSVRYEIVKKRIDKVLIKETNERLTQPEKVALVYFTKSEEEEYLEYIVQLQDEGYFNNDLELLELEDLQGVHGLKAIRVGIN
jgi:hypothetical protein